MYFQWCKLSVNLDTDATKNYYFIIYNISVQCSGFFFLTFQIGTYNNIIIYNKMYIYWPARCIGNFGTSTSRVFYVAFKRFFALYFTLMRQSNLVVNDLKIMRISHYDDNNVSSNRVNTFGYCLLKNVQKCNPI